MQRFICIFFCSFVRIFLVCSFVFVCYFKYVSFCSAFSYLDSVKWYLFLFYDQCCPDDNDDKQPMPLSLLLLWYLAAFLSLRPHLVFGLVSLGHTKLIFYMYWTFSFQMCILPILFRLLFQVSNLFLAFIFHIYIY